MPVKKKKIRANATRVTPRKKAKPSPKRTETTRTRAKPLLSPEDLAFGFVDTSYLYLCLRCAMELLTKRLGLAPRTAYAQMRQFVPTDADLARQQINPPHFFSTDESPRCPHCDATTRLLARLDILRLE